MKHEKVLLRMCMPTYALKTLAVTFWETSLHINVHFYIF